jgi:hypothetical protein
MSEVEGWKLRPRSHPSKCNSDLALHNATDDVCGSGCQHPMCGAVASQEWGLWRVGSSFTVVGLLVRWLSGA